jgi:diguanylate cyclase (GGDEF)-like protein
MVCRQGGDEFMILLEDVNSVVDIELVAQKIMAEMSVVHRLGEIDRTVSFSIGAAIYPDDASNDETLTQCADQAMYLAKQNGRNNFQQYKAGSPE